MGVTGREDSGPAAAFVAAWFSLRAEDRGAAAVALPALRGRAARIVAGRCRCGFAVAEDHVADAVFVMVYGIRRAPRLRISATTTLAYLCGVARNEWRWDRWRRARTGVPLRRRPQAGPNSRINQRRVLTPRALGCSHHLSSPGATPALGPCVDSGPGRMPARCPAVRP